MAGTRSPNYPSLSLSEAVEHASRLYQKERRSAVEADQAVRAWGYAGLSGPSRTKLSALRKYGLVEDRPDGVRISDRAMAVLFPDNASEEQAALLDAAMSVELFRDLSTYEGASDDNLVSRLVRGGFTPPGAKAAVASYRETMRLVEVEAKGYDASHGPAAPESAPQTIQAVGIPAPAMMSPTESGTAFSLTLPNGARADLRVAGPINKDGIELLREYLNLVEKTVSQPEASRALVVVPRDDSDGDSS